MPSRYGALYACQHHPLQSIKNDRHGQDTDRRAQKNDLRTVPLAHAIGFTDDVRYRPGGHGGQNHTRDLIPSLEKADEEKAELVICMESTIP